MSSERQTLGMLDADSMKETLDWHTAIIETLPTSVSPAGIIRNEAELVAEFKRSKSEKDFGKKGESFPEGFRTPLSLNHFQVSGLPPLLDNVDD